MRRREPGPLVSLLLGVVIVCVVFYVTMLAVARVVR